MRLSVITVTTNTATHQKDIFRQCLASVETGWYGPDLSRALPFRGEGNMEHFVSDNGSTDDTVQMVKTEFPNVKVIENGKNLGFGGGNNVAFWKSTGEFVLFLNPDNIVRPGSLKVLYDYMLAHPKVGIVGPKLVDQFGKINESAKPRRFPKFFEQIVILLKLPHIFPRVLDEYAYKDMDMEKKQEVDSVRGSFMFVRRKLLDGLGRAFDPRYFIWFEDVDLCREAWIKGYKVVYNPSVECVDYVGQTFKRLSFFKKQRWFAASMFKYFYKWKK